MLVPADLRGTQGVIDPRAIVDPSVEIGANVAIGPWTVVGADVTIGDDCWIASHVVLKGPTTLGRGTRIYQFSTVGEDTPAFDYQGERTTLEIGADNIIREGVTIHRGTVQDQGRTVIGDNNLLMAYVHIGHDCEIGNHVIMANNAALSGHVVIGDYANMGGYAGVPQYRSVGAYTHIAAMSLVLKDVPAFAASFALVALFWFAHRTWSRRYGLDDFWSVMLSLTLVFLVLVWVYPLRILFGAAFAWLTGLALPAGWRIPFHFRIDAIGEIRLKVVEGNGIPARKESCSGQGQGG